MSHFTEVKNRVDVPVVIANHDGFVTFINGEFTNIYEWKPEDLIGKPLTKILPKIFSDAHNLAFSRFQATEIVNVLNHPLELMTVTKSDREVLSEHFITAEKIDGIWHFAAVLRPLA